MTLIDLDRPGSGPEPRPPRRRGRPVLGGLALVVAAAVGGGLVTDRWRAQRQRDAERSAVSVVLLPDPLRWPDDSVGPATVINSSVVQVELSGHVQVVNAGPAAVRFVGFRADRAGLQLRGAAVYAEPVAPGEFTEGAAQATMTCADRPPSGPVAATVEVESADGVLRRPTVAFDWRPWADQLTAACDRPAPDIWSRR
jgi:hypothetical protein